MPPRYVHLMFHLDTNRINARQCLENMNVLEKWSDNGVIALEMSEVSLREAFAGNSDDRKKKASGYMFSMSCADTPHEKSLLRDIQLIIFPDGVKDQNQQNDVEVVFNAAKYHRTLITNDGASRRQPGGILGNAKRLKAKVGVDIVTDEEAIINVRRYIDRRDEMARYVSEHRGVKLPEWVGED